MLLTEVPPPPENLGPIGQDWWKYYCGLLIESKVLSLMFVGSVSNLCKTAELIDEIESAIRAEGSVTMIVKKYQGEEYTTQITNPMVRDLQSLYNTFSRLANDLGLTPFSAHANAIDSTGEAQESAIPTPPKAEFDSPVSISMVG